MDAEQLQRRLSANARGFVARVRGLRAFRSFRRSISGSRRLPRLRRPSFVSSESAQESPMPGIDYFPSTDNGPSAHVTDQDQERHVEGLGRTLSFVRANADGTNSLPPPRTGIRYTTSVSVTENKPESFVQSSLAPTVGRGSMMVEAEIPLSASTYGATSDPPQANDTQNVFQSGTGFLNLPGAIGLGRSRSEATIVVTPPADQHHVRAEESQEHPITATEKGKGKAVRTPETEANISSDPPLSLPALDTGLDVRGSTLVHQPSRAGPSSSRVSSQGGPSFTDAGPSSSRVGSGSSRSGPSFSQAGPSSIRAGAVSIRYVSSSSQAGPSSAEAGVGNAEDQEYFERQASALLALSCAMALVMASYPGFLSRLWTATGQLGPVVLPPQDAQSHAQIQHAQMRANGSQSNGEHPDGFRSLNASPIHDNQLNPNQGHLWELPGLEHFNFNEHPFARPIDDTWILGDSPVEIVQCGNLRFRVPRDLANRYPTWNVVFQIPVTPGTPYNVFGVHPEGLRVAVAAVWSTAGLSGLEPGLNLVRIVLGIEATFQLGMDAERAILLQTLNRYIARRLLYHNPHRPDFQGLLDHNYYVYRSEEIYRAFLVVLESNTNMAEYVPEVNLARLYTVAIPGEMWPALTVNFSDFFCHIIDHMEENREIPQIQEFPVFWYERLVDTGAFALSWSADFPQFERPAVLYPAPAPPDGPPPPPTTPPPPNPDQQAAMAAASAAAIASAVNSPGPAGSMIATTSQNGESDDESNSGQGSPHNSVIHLVVPDGQAGYVANINVTDIHLAEDEAEPERANGSGGPRD